MKRVEFSEDGTQLLAVTEKRMGFLGTIVVFDIKLDVEAEQTSERSLTITCEESKATVAGWSFLSKYIIAGHEDGTVSQYDAKVQIPPTQKTKSLIFFQNGELIDSFAAHEDGGEVKDLQWSPDHTYFITASKDKTAKVKNPFPLKKTNPKLSPPPSNPNH